MAGCMGPNREVFMAEEDEVCMYERSLKLGVGLVPRDRQIRRWREFIIIISYIFCGLLARASQYQFQLSAWGDDMLGFLELKVFLDFGEGVFRLLGLQSLEREGRSGEGVVDQQWGSHFLRYVRVRNA
ncbi:hypothetical protein TorRG33x02_163040 [Trema orientale]|uniref:Uncharacterized protein n=1 Tax=Trema orientale TaxID=63057 RepID=A0A2P5ER24_TREOI|nr:hypothetical protein TorRG33x02_163040 [Trema orientale]